MSNKETVLEAQDLGKEVSSPEGPLAIVRDVSFQVRAGESVAIVGASGAGKSTLLALLAGLDLPSSGRVLLAGQDLNSLDEDGRARLRAERVGFVFQSYNLIPSLTARENVALITEICRDPMAPEEALAMVDLADRLDHFPAQLSGGEQQMLAIARALARDIKVLLLDEPYEGLAPVIVQEIAKTLSVIRDQGITTIIVEQNAVAALKLADRAVILDTGTVVYDGSAQEVLDDEALRAKYLAI